MEVVAAITLRLRRGTTTPQDAALAIATFRQDFSRELYAVPVTLTVIKHAMDLAEKHGLRGYDAVQLTTALQVQSRCRLERLPSPIFLSADTALNAAASAEGLAVDNPNAHP